MSPIQSDSLAINFQFDIIRKKCIHCGQLILRKISKTGAARRQDFKSKMCQIRFPLGLDPDPAGGAYSAPLDPLVVFKGTYF